MGQIIMIDLPHKVALESTEGMSVENSLGKKKKRYYMHECVLALNYFSASILISSMVMTNRN